MPYNLIHESWIPLRRRDGTVETVAPWQITDAGDANDNPFVAVAAPRPDFSGAIIQFLIGLVQTTCAPDDAASWRRGITHTPDAAELHTAFSTVEEAFNLDGDGPRFMQDFEELDGKENPINYLLIDTPTDNTLKQNKDHFTKRPIEAPRWSYAASAMALMTLQTNAPGGGQGHRTGLRGGGPLTTIVLGSTLWETIWLNVLEPSRLPGSKFESDRARLFPWCGPTRTSEKKTGQATTPVDVHPLHVFWAMPRRIRLDFETATPGTCALTGVQEVPTIGAYVTRNYGYDYTGPWRHHLTAYSLNKDNEPNPQKGQPGGVTYQHWLGLVITDEDNSRQPAQVVKAFESRMSFAKISDTLRFKPRLWAFGYDMDNMKARCWYEATMPLYLIEDELRARFELYAKECVRTADLLNQNLKHSVKKALFLTPKWSGKKIDWKGKADTKNSFFQGLTAQFWADTEADFHNTLQALISSMRSTQGERSDINAVKLSWLNSLRKQALNLFDLHSQNGHFNAVDPKAIACARSELRRFSSDKTKSVINTLGLEKKAPAPKA